MVPKPFQSPSGWWVVQSDKLVSEREMIAEEIPDVAGRLIGRIRAYGPVAVAYSGGVDSAVVARAAVEAWPNQAVAVTAVSPSLPEAERESARAEAARIGIRHVELSTQEFTRTAYRQNAPDRCYHCKDSLYGLLNTQLELLQVRCIVNGANLDDLGDHRPGMRAALDYSVKSPLIDEKISKSTVRRLARFWNLSVAEKPASPCLSSRIAYGVEVTEQRVKMVEDAEEFIRRLTGIAELRVRCEVGDLARIEVPLTEIEVLAKESVRQPLVACLQSLGFRRVTLDLEGFRSGSMNEGVSLVNLVTPAVEE